MNRRCTALALCSAALTLLAAGPAASQEIISALLPDSTAVRLVAFHNLETTTRLTGDARIGPGTVMRGGVHC
jgi:hypothetical protein